MYQSPIRVSVTRCCPHPPNPPSDATAVDVVHAIWLAMNPRHHCGIVIFDVTNNFDAECDSKIPHEVIRVNSSGPHISGSSELLKQDRGRVFHYQSNRNDDTTEFDRLEPRENAYHFFKLWRCMSYVL